MILMHIFLPAILASYPQCVQPGMTGERAKEAHGLYPGYTQKLIVILDTSISVNEIEVLRKSWWKLG